MQVVNLTEGQRKFCEEYAKSYNATQSYLKAYPNASYDTANAQSWRLLREQKIKDYLTQLEKEHYDAQRINYEHIASTLAEMAFSDDEDKKIKLKALDLLQKQLGLQSQSIKADISTTIEVNIE